MTDDRTKKGPQDRSRINIHERYELDYWSNKFGVTPKDLKLAVEKVGEPPRLSRRLQPLRGLEH
ncbi:MAG: DUF3606 domain-containing protein, partial [Pseudomonadota bacterium]